VFLGYCVARVSCLILGAGDHAALPTFSAVMMGFVIPITVVTLAVSLIRRPTGASAPTETPGNG